MKRHNPEKRTYRGKSYKKGGTRVKALRDKPRVTKVEAYIDYDVSMFGGCKAVVRYRGF